MRLTFKQLKHLRVETRSGVMLGHIHEVVTDADSQSIVQYMVRSSVIGGDEYLIGRTQVLQFTQEKMIVEDGVKKIESAKQRKRAIDISPEAVTMRKET